MQDENKKLTQDESFAKSDKRPFKERMAIWYSYNKQKIPFYLMMIGAILVTATLDFNPQRQGWEFISHFQAMTWIFHLMPNSITALLPFIFFMNYLLVIVLFFIAFSYSRKRSPFLTILYNILALGSLALLGIYIISAFGAMGAPGAQARMVEPIVTSISFLIPAFILILASMVMSWFYVDWNYTSIDE